MVQCLQCYKMVQCLQRYKMVQCLQRYKMVQCLQRYKMVYNVIKWSYIILGTVGHSYTAKVLDTICGSL